MSCGPCFVSQRHRSKGTRGRGGCSLPRRRISTAREPPLPRRSAAPSRLLLHNCRSVPAVSPPGSRLTPSPPRRRRLPTRCRSLLPQCCRRRRRRRGGSATGWLRQRRGPRCRGRQRRGSWAGTGRAARPLRRPLPGGQCGESAAQPPFLPSPPPLRPRRGVDALCDAAATLAPATREARRRRCCRRCAAETTAAGGRRRVQRLTATARAAGW